MSSKGNYTNKWAQDREDERRLAELKSTKAQEQIPPGRLAALVAALSTKEKGGKRK